MKRKRKHKKRENWPPVKSVDEFNRQYLPVEIGDRPSLGGISGSQFGKRLAAESILLMKESLASSQKCD
jgi:hypothetical protein